MIRGGIYIVTPDFLMVTLAVAIRIVLTALIVMLLAWYILQIRPIPYVKAFLISSAAHLLAKAADVLLQWPLEIVAAIPGLVLLVLTFLLFDASVKRILAVWFVGFGIYLVIHALLSVLFDVTFLFAF